MTPPDRSGHTNFQKSGVVAEGGVNLNIGDGESEMQYSLNDMNGDGLLDRVYKDGMVQLNLGYKFSGKEDWKGGKINDGENTVSGGGLGGAIGIINRNNSSFEAGIGVSSSENETEISYSDVNGDGLADQVISGDQLKVKLNTGAGFSDEIDWTYASRFGQGTSLTEFANLAFTYTIPIGFPPIFKIAINPSINVSRSFNQRQIPDNRF
jgi:hypothetical protein